MSSRLCPYLQDYSYGPLDIVWLGCIIRDGSSIIFLGLASLCFWRSSDLVRLKYTTVFKKIWSKRLFQYSLMVIHYISFYSLIFLFCSFKARQLLLRCIFRRHFGLFSLCFFLYFDWKSATFGSCDTPAVHHRSTAWNRNDFYMEFFLLWYMLYAVYYNMPFCYIRESWDASDWTLPRAFTSAPDSLIVRSCVFISRLVLARKYYMSTFTEVSFLQNVTEFYVHTYVCVILYIYCNVSCWDSVAVYNLIISCICIY